MNHNEYELARYHRNRDEAIRAKGGKCVICGSTKQIEFDHIDPKDKSFNIAKMWSYSPSLIKAELEKCQLLCFLCHKEKTFAPVRAARKHGTWAMYRRAKCRCDICRDFFNEYRRDLRARHRSGMV